MFCCLETAQKGVGIERKCVLSELSNLWERGGSYMHGNDVRGKGKKTKHRSNRIKKNPSRTSITQL